MSLIDETYFTGRLNIPNTDKDYVLERLQGFIDRYEPEFLQNVFGYPLWELLDAELQAEEEDSGSVFSYSTRFERLINGYEYTGLDTMVHKWRGLVFTTGLTPRSMVANYIYWHWLKDQNTQTVGLGEVATKAENAVGVSPTIKQVTAWNELSEMFAELYYFLQSNTTDYPEYVSYNGKLHVLRMFTPQNQFGI